MYDTIIIKDIIDEDFTNYKIPSMFIATSRCTFKCEKEDCNVKCQNSKITNQPNIEISIDKLINRYINNPITSAIVFGGLEPFDQFSELLSFIKRFRNVSSDDIIIYTGYTELEINYFKHNRRPFLNLLLEVNKKASNKDSKSNRIIIKYGRYKSSGDKIFDNVLGVELASANQYAKLYEYEYEMM